MAHNVLIICKDDAQVLECAFGSINLYISQHEQLPVRFYFDTSSIMNHGNKELISDFVSSSLDTTRYWERRSEKMDVIFTFGGDGTVLHAAWQFQNSSPPPIIPMFVHGTLGFLTAFDCSNYSSLLNTFLETPLKDLSIRKRIRLCCKLLNESDEVVNVFHVINEVVVDRGPFSCLIQLDLYSGDKKDSLTTILADGVVIATPTGSTAYSMSAGGAIIHPEVPGILLTPICAHTLSFRPLLVPDRVALRLAISPSSRTESAWLSFDGRHRLELDRGVQLEVSVSEHPVYVVSRADQTAEWFKSLSTCLHWNDSRRVWGAN